MIKRDLTDEEKRFIKNQQDTSPVVRYFKTKDQLNFTVGDYLIKLNKRGDGDRWETETISHVSNQPKRFICIYEDEYGIKYIKPLTSMGKELPNIIQLTETSDWTRYEIDPDFAEHIIINGDDNDFDFSDKRKKDKALRDQITKKNKKISKKIQTVIEADSFLTGLKVGDKIWFGHSIPSAATSIPWLVISASKPKPYSWGGPARQRTQEIELQQHYINAPNGSYVRSFNSESFLGNVVFETEPFKYETI